LHIIFDCNSDINTMLRPPRTTQQMKLELGVALEIYIYQPIHS